MIGTPRPDEAPDALWLLWIALMRGARDRLPFRELSRRPRRRGHR